MVLAVDCGGGEDADGDEDEDEGDDEGGAGGGGGVGGGGLVGAPLVAYTTAGGGFIGWDVRAAKPAWQMRAPAAAGLMRKLVMDPGGLWAATGR